MFSWAGIFGHSQIKAKGKLVLDMQANGITETGARMVSHVLTMNKEIQIVDIRNNAFGNAFVGTIP